MPQRMENIAVALVFIVFYQKPFGDTKFTVDDKLASSNATGQSTVHRRFRGPNVLIRGRLYDFLDLSNTKLTVVRARKTANSAKKS